ncbi:hypothetical protein QTP88_028180 [Uroleucon formosanum]
MKTRTSLQCIFILFFLCIVRLGCCAPQNEDDVTNTTINSPVDQLKDVESYSAAEMCTKYSKLIYKYIKDPILFEYEEEVLIKVKDCLNSLTLIVNGTKAEPKEFPHMVLLGYSKYPRSDSWGCGGSLISNRWILSAAHCERLGNTSLVRWARVGDLNYLLETDDARPMDYQIDERIVHPDYQKPSLYNDIALFHLDQDVEFSSYVRPLCLNGDPNWQSNSPQIVIATGWGRTENEGPTSPDLLRVNLEIISPSSCKSNYASIDKNQLMHGIVEDSMICAGYPGGEKDTCGGDSGGPLQIAHATYSCMYTQIGITSAGKECATKNSPGIYTKVSKFLPWIERIVWPNKLSYSGSMATIVDMIIFRPVFPDKMFTTKFRIWSEMKLMLVFSIDLVCSHSRLSCEMKSITSLQCIFMLLILCIVRLGCCLPQNKDDVTNTTSNPPVDKSKGIETYSAAEMCSNYSQLIYKYIYDSISIDDGEVLIEVEDCHNNYPIILNGAANVDDKMAAPREFPHMALLGYSKYPRNDIWICSGSLISNRWILSTASCERLGNTTLVRWARLGDLNYLSETDDARPMDYQIDQRVVHPNYQPPSMYNDIALFRLDQDVEFSAYVRPICLNTEPKLKSSPSQIVITTGWGRIRNGNEISSDLLKVSLDIISADLCKSHYASIGEKQLMHGVAGDSIICAGDLDGEKDNCGGFAGSSLQIVHAKHTCMYTQVGVLSAGKMRCSQKDSPDIYTRVFKFLPWIEQIVWLKSG